MKELLNKKVLLAIVAAVIAVAAALGATGVVKYACIGEKFLGGEPSNACVESEK
jgi:hypothetical protein